MKALLKTLKGKIIVAAATVGTVGIGVTAALLIMGQKEETYYTIAVQEVNGSSVVTDDKAKTMDAYEGMHLYSGYDVKVQDNSDLTLQLDMERYVYAEPNTHFTVEADDSGKKVQINLLAGAEINRIDRPLQEGESYQVNTPNSVMAVRGTIFRVVVEKDDTGYATTNLDVFQGNVNLGLTDAEGNPTGETISVEAGKAAVIEESASGAEFVTDESGNVIREIDYKSIPQNTALELIEYIEAGEELSITADLLKDYTKLEEHKYEEVVVEATCSQEGKTEEVCTVCGEVLNSEIIEKLPHTESYRLVSEPTCTEDGSEEYFCEVCGEIIETVILEQTGHTPGEWQTTTEATCEAKGLEEQFCEVCGELVDSKDIKKLPCEPGEWETTLEPTCVDEGTQVQYCINCDEQVNEQSIAALGHTYGNWATVTAPGCTTTGTEEHICEVCGYVEPRSIAATGHNYGNYTTTLQPGCTTTGNQQGSCAVCGAINNIVIAALGHSYGEWEITEYPYCPDGITGEKMHACTVCGAEETAVVPAEHSTEGSPMEHDTMYISGLDPADVQAPQVLVYKSCNYCSELVATTEYHTLTYADGAWECPTCETRYAN